MGEQQQQEQQQQIQGDEQTIAMERLKRETRSRAKEAEEAASERQEEQ